MELDLSDNAFGPDGVRGFEALLKSPACYTLQELKLNNCGMGIGGGKVRAVSLLGMRSEPGLVYTEWLRLKGIFGDCLVQLSCPKQSEQVARGCV